MKLTTTQTALLTLLRSGDARGAVAERVSEEAETLSLTQLTPWRHRRQVTVTIHPEEIDWLESAGLVELQTVCRKDDPATVARWVRPTSKED